MLGGGFKVGGANMDRSRAYLVIFVLLVLGLSCGRGLKAQQAMEETNPCAYRAPEADFLPATATPPPPPALSQRPPTATPSPPSSEPPPYPSLPAPELSPGVDAWKDAIVGVRVETSTGVEWQSGLVVHPHGKVLTVLDTVREVESVSVQVTDRGTLAARVERLDPRTGAALLTVPASGLMAAPKDSDDITVGEPVLVLSRGEDGSLNVRETFASPSLNAPEHLFALLRPYTPIQATGSIVINRLGKLVGLAADPGVWGYGRRIDFGTTYLDADQPAVRLPSTRGLFKGAPSQSDSIPSAVGRRGGTVVDGPVTREKMAHQVQRAIHQLGRAESLDGLGRRTWQVTSGAPGTVLDLVYAEPQQLRASGGKGLGSGRYLVLWWDRGEGAPDLVMCGTEPGYVGAAFAALSLEAIESVLEQAPSGGDRSIVQATPLPGTETEHNPSHYHYPFRWGLKTDQASYLPGEEVRLTFTATNVSQWPMSLNYLPPTVAIYIPSGQRLAVVIPHGQEHRTLSLGETVSFPISWDGADARDEQAPPGLYRAGALMAAGEQWSLGFPGPGALIALLPAAGALRLSLTPGLTVTAVETAVTLERVEFGHEGTTVYTRVDWTDPSLQERGRQGWTYGYTTVDGGPTSPIWGTSGDEEGTTVRKVWELPPLPANARSFTFVITQIGHLLGGWQFTLDLDKDRRP